MVDLNRDGYLDCAYVINSQDEVRASLNLGNLTFGTEYLITSQIPTPEYLGSIDMDGDGDQDLYIGGAPNYIYWITNDSLGIGLIQSTDLPNTSYNPNYIFQLDAADFDLNGFSDFITYKSGLATSIIYNLDGSQLSLDNNFSGSGYFLLADIDNNARTDILTRDKLYLKSRDTTDFLEVPFQAIGSLHSILDFDGDQTPDIVQNDNGKFFLTSIFFGGSCNDGIKNRDEEYIDCGGSFCSECYQCQGDTLFIQDRPISQYLKISAANAIISNGRVDRYSEVTFKAGDNVTLLNSFEIAKNAQFQIVIDTCN